MTSDRSKSKTIINPSVRPNRNFISLPVPTSKNQSPVIAGEEVESYSEIRPIKNNNRKAKTKKYHENIGSNVVMPSLTKSIKKLSSTNKKKLVSHFVRKQKNSTLKEKQTNHSLSSFSESISEDVTITKEEKKDVEFATIQDKLEFYEKQLKLCLSIENANITKALRVLDEIDKAPIEANILKDCHSLVTTVSKIRKYKLSQKVMDKSEKVYHQLKLIFTGLEVGEPVTAVIQGVI